MKESVTKNLTASDIFNILNVKDQEEAEKVFKFTLSFLSYLSVGDSIVTNDSTFTKVSVDLLQVETNINLEDVIDTFDKRKIINVKF